jgi:nucleotide-binding universal stress UspA family protein
MKDSGPILVPLDGSELAEGALPYAAALGRALGAPLVLLTTWEGTESELGMNFPAMAVEVEQKAREHYTKYLEDISKKLGKGVSADVEVRAGDAAEQILAAAAERDARLLVIATHGRSGISRWMYGSTAGHLLRSADVPVMAVGPQALQKPAEKAVIKHIMLPLDGSDVSEAAIPAAQKLATTLKAKLSLVRAVRWAAQTYPYTLPDAYIPQVDEELEAGARDYLKRQQEALSGVDAEAFVVRGAVADGLLEFVEQQSVDLIVMTTHARTGLARAALGSVADRMIQAPAPVLLIRPEIAER